MLFIFLASLVLYAGAYAWIEHRRAFKGPWEVEITQTEEGLPALKIEQPHLGIRDVRLVFEHAAPATVQTQRLVFGNPPRPFPYPIPHGQVVFLDTTFLPGTVTLQLFGHELELLPRTLIVNRREVPWKSGATLRLQEPPKLPPLSQKALKRRRQESQ